jgi:TnpA family transposase
LAQGIAEFGRIDKTLHSLRFIGDKDMRRGTLPQLNLGEGRHSVGRVRFQPITGRTAAALSRRAEDQLGALGLVVNMIVLWNTIYMEAVLEQFRKEKKVSPANERKLYSSLARISATYGDFERFERESTRSQNGEETRKLTSTELREPEK